MNNRELGELLQGQLDAIQAATALLRQVARERQEEAPYIGKSPRLLFAGEHGLRMMLRAFPGFGLLWRQSVPADFLGTVSIRDSREVVRTIRCVCGGATLLAYAEPAQCAGGCGRWFLELGESVRVYKP